MNSFIEEFYYGNIDPQARSEYSVALKAPVRQTGNQLSGYRKSTFRCGGATIPELETSIPEWQNRFFTCLFAYCGIQSIYFSHGAVVGRVCWNNVDPVGIMLDAVQDCLSKRTVIPTKLVVPSGGIVLGAEDRG